jgi:alkylation response protein AidB-like acyl-CoA dehydrogenase
METVAVRGGSWLFDEVEDADVFTPERLTDEHRLIGKTTEEFMAAEVLAHVEQLESKDWAFSRHLIKRAGELGLLGLTAPEQYGGLDLDKVSSLVVVEKVARSASFAATFGGQSNLCVLPLVLFGTAEQKAAYLPRLIAGEMVGAYALSESGSGSDALAARTRAVKLADGSWSLTGEKMWITNGGFADLFVIFAKVDGEQFTAFLVERTFPGVTTGKEEHKMGLHGSSTTAVILQDARVPAGNVLGDIGRGHKVALNTLNYGRFSLGAMCAGGAKAAVGDAVRYATGRKQFGQAIASFGAIRHKLGEITVRAYVAECLSYRTAGLIDLALDGSSKDGAAVAKAFEEFAIEESICKVACSEALDFVLDENVQIHGGNGFVRDYAAERYFRDARVNRIFEGTNEINRLLIPGMLVRRGLKSELPLVPAARRLQDDILSLAPGSGADGGGPLASESRTVGAFKQVALMVIGTALQTYGDALEREQEVLCCAADILIDTYASESALSRARQSRAAGAAPADLHEAATRVYVHDAAAHVEASAKTAFAAMADGDQLRTLLAALRRVLKPAPVNTVALRRHLADAVAARGGYIL